MIISNHHILYDGWSNGIILKEFFNVYNDLAHKRTPPKPVKKGFKEYIKWIKSQDKNKLEKFLIWSVRYEKIISCDNVFDFDYWLL